MLSEQTCSLPNRARSEDQVRRGKADKFPRCNDLGFLPELRKVPAIPSDEVVGTGFVGALQKNVVVRVAAYVEAARRLNEMAVIPDELQQPEAEPPTYMEFRA
jgi:hypothetical protein